MGLHRYLKARVAYPYFDVADRAVVRTGFDQPLDVCAAYVTRHDDDCVSEIDSSAVTVGQSPIVQNLALAWEAAVSGVALGSTNRTMSQWAEEFHERRRTLDPTLFPVDELPDPFPKKYRFKFTRTATGSEAQTFYYVDPPVCFATATVRSRIGTHGVIKILP